MLALKEGLLYCNAQYIELGLRGPVNWAGRTVQVEATVNTMHEGSLSYCRCHHGEENEGQRAWMPLSVEGDPPRPSAAVCNVNDWMQGLDEGASNREVGRTDDV